MFKITHFFRKKVFLLLIVLVLIPVIFAACLAISIEYKNSSDDITETGKLIVNNESDYIERFFNLGITTINVGSDNTVGSMDPVDFYSYFRSSYLTKTGSNNVADIALFESDRLVRGNVYIDLYCSSQNIIYSDFLHKITDLDASTRSNIDKDPYNYYWDLQNDISIYKRIYFSKDQLETIVKMTFNVSVLKRNVVDQAPIRSLIVLCIGDKNYVLYGNENQFKPELSDYLKSGKLDGISNSYLTLDSQISSNYIHRDDAKLVMFIPKQEIMNKLTGQIYYFIFIFSIILISIIGILFLISITITKRLYDLTGNIDRNVDDLIKNEFSTKAINKSDEFDFINNKIYELINKVNEYNVKLTDTQLQKKQLEIKLLQELFNPHFLYNTLSSIKYSVKGNKEVENIVDNMVRYYRNALNNGKAFHAIAEEIDLIKIYINIQKFSYDTEFEFNVTIDREAENCKIIKQLLQPFVENSFLHGILRNETNGKINVDIRLKNECVVIVISDNGEGMPQEKLDLLSNFDDEENKTGYGIYNSVQKMKTSYGDNYSIKFESEIDKGTAVTITIPAIF